MKKINCYCDTMNDEIKILLFSFLDIAPNRLKVFRTFQDQEILRPKEIAIKTGIKINLVSRALRQLKDNDLVYVLNPNVRANRNYRLTKKGEKLIKYLN